MPEGSTYNKQTEPRALTHVTLAMMGVTNAGSSLEAGVVTGAWLGQPGD